MANIQMRVSLRFEAVCRAIADKFNCSMPVATEIILDQFSKGGLIVFGDRAALEKIIEKTTSKHIRDNQSSSLENKHEQKEKKNDMVDSEKTGSHQPVKGNVQTVPTT